MRLLYNDMHILITGGTGFIGQKLCQALLALDHELTILVRNKELAQKKLGQELHYIQDFAQLDQNTEIDVIINLAGEPIADKRWSQERKKQLRASRIGMTEAIGQLVDRLTQKPKLMISASAIGFYGPQDDQKLDETADPIESFSHSLCRKWEAAARNIESAQTRVIITRFGLVLGNDGGALKKMLLPFKLGLGGKMGTGQQWFSWVHIDDVISALLFLMNKPEVSGTFNFTAPHPVQNHDFAAALARVLKRPAFFSTPGSVLKLVYGEMAEELLLTGQRVIPSHLEQLGYEFKFPFVYQALQNLCES